MTRLFRKSRTALIPLTLGALAATGFQPLGLWPVTLACLAGLITLVEHQSGRWRAFLVGWLFGVGHFSVGNGWIATAFTYQANMPAWLGWIAVVLLSLYLAVFPALAAMGAWIAARRWKAAMVPAFAACWIITEWLRSWAFSGFAWNPLGVVTLGGFARPGLAALAPWLGTYALSGLVALLAGQWLFAARAWIKGQKMAAAAYTALPAVLFLLPLRGHGEQGSLPYTLVQPDLQQDQINDPRLFEGQFQRIAALSLAHDPKQPRLVLWPESAVPDYLQPGYDPYWYAQTTYAGDPDMARARIGRVIGPNALLLTGAVDLAMDRRRQVTGAWNVITALDGQGTIRGSYAKAHLVPYGEYLPMRDILGPLGLSRLVAGQLDFFAGPGPRTMDFGTYGKAGFQICYEIIFSGQVVDRAHRPDYIFNPSNDGWFGSWGPPQHLAQARLRAIEEGLPVLRATTTGISAVIDADGVVRQHVGRNMAGRLDGMVPPAHAATLFARTGNALPLAWATVLLVIALVARRKPVG
ncbi:apolipoprotein N-acyltransferase [Novosphingobium percolationis]|uniref:apolipoprotein N-acyltransferase n=1 Tax=Novosphingobium percolationis TaxID=2871811 RepID=UPI001CD5F09F|nr:apolipoprotein N-acyltransferase [Novosphingobium percolationis]